MEQTPCEGSALAFIDAAIFALEQARRVLTPERVPNFKWHLGIGPKDENEIDYDEQADEHDLRMLLDGPGPSR